MSGPHRDSTRGVQLSRRLYRAATLLLPATFRSEYGSELEECFAVIARDARRRGRWALAAVTATSLADVARRALTERSTERPSGPAGTGLGHAGDDLRAALRGITRRPAFAVVATFTLALGIAAVTAVFTLVDRVLLAPLPYPDPDRIVQIDHAGPGVGAPRGLGITHGFYRFYAERLTGVAEIAMYAPINLTLTGRGDPVQLPGTLATPSLGAVLGVRPERGRWFTAREGEPGADPTVVLSHRMWTERFGADAGVIGSALELEGIVREVVGVMPAGVAFPSRDVEYWVPLELPASGVGGWNQLSVARLADGVEPAALAAEIASLFPLLRASTDDPTRVAAYLDEARVQPLVEPLRDSLVRDVRETLWILQGSVGLVLVIAVANVATLLLLRADERQREAAVRTALGASRARLLRAHLWEMLLIAGAATAAGVATAAACVGLLRQRAPVEVPRLDEVGIDASVVLVAVVISLAVALLLGLAPGLRAPGDPAGSLGGVRVTAGRARVRGRSVLVAGQVALALMLLVGSGLLLRTFMKLRAVDPGFSLESAVVFDVGLPRSRYDRARAVAAHEELLGRLDAIPGVDAAVAVAPCLPLSGFMCWGEVLEVEGRPMPSGEMPPVTGARIVTDGYFAAMGIPLRGRTFERGDISGPDAAILSEAAARAYFPDEDALGRRVRFDGDGPWLTVVGIAGNVRARLATDEFQRAIYLPITPTPSAGPQPGSLSYVLATPLPAADVLAEVRRILNEIDPTLPVIDPRTMAELIARPSAPASFALVLVGAAGFVALLLGSVGVYAVVAYAVGRRTREIGVRMAIGASAGSMRAMVFVQGGAIIAAGIVAGLVGAAALMQLLRGMLFGVSPNDPISYVAVTVIMLTVGSVALLIPARRASRVDPLEALRSD